MVCMYVWLFVTVLSCVCMCIWDCLCPSFPVRVCFYLIQTTICVSVWSEKRGFMCWEKQKRWFNGKKNWDFEIGLCLRCVLQFNSFPHWWEVQIRIRYTRPNCCELNSLVRKLQQCIQKCVAWNSSARNGGPLLNASVCNSIQMHSHWECAQSATLCTDK